MNDEKKWKNEIGVFVKVLYSIIYYKMIFIENILKLSHLHKLRMELIKNNTKQISFSMYITAIVAHNDAVLLASSTFARSTTSFCFSIVFCTTKITSSPYIEFNSLYRL